MHADTILIQRARALLVPVLVTLGATAVHHVYGGIRYATPWRIHGAVIALLVGALLGGLYRGLQRAPGTRRGRAAGWAMALLSLLYPVTLIGAFEGVYNHVAKNLLYYGGMSPGRLLELFPPPTYELPNDFSFELTGVLQVVPAALALLASLSFVRALPRGRETSFRLAEPPPRRQVRARASAAPPEGDRDAGQAEEREACRTTAARTEPR